MIFEEHVVTHEKWHRSYSWQMTLRLGFCEPSCAKDWLSMCQSENNGHFNDLFFVKPLKL